MHVDLIIYYTGPPEIFLFVGSWGVENCSPYILLGIYVIGRSIMLGAREKKD